jgi:hypothetical protein
MVQPLPPTVPGRRPEMPAGRPVSRSINASKFEEFKKHLRRSTEGPPQAPEASPDKAQASARGRSEDREMGSEDDSSRTLAPEEQSGWGRGSLDPAEWLSSITSPGGVGPGPVAESNAAGRLPEPQLAELVEGWVRRLSVGGDQRRAVARLDIGHGAYAGAELVIATEGGAVQVELTLPEGAPASGLSERLASRLTARGYEAQVAVR